MGKTQDSVEVRSFKLRRIDVKIMGKTPLLMEKMDESIPEKYNKKKGNKIQAPDQRMEEDKVEGKIHLTPDGKPGFPCAGFLNGMAFSAPYCEVEIKRAKSSIKFLEPIVPIQYKSQDVLVSWGKTAGQTKSPRKIIRPIFKDWSCVLKIEFNEDAISAEQIVNILNVAGFHAGIGGWRPSSPKNAGMYGQYKVV